MCTFLRLSLCSIILLLLGPIPLCESRNDPDQIAKKWLYHYRSLKTEEGSHKCKGKILTPHFLFYKNIRSYTSSSPKDYTITKGSKVFVNLNEKTFERKDLYPSCTFTPIREQGPTPVLFLVEGRSGSSNTWMTLSNLAGGANEALETVGSSGGQLKEFFNDYLKSEEEASWWVTEHMCEMTKYNCNSAIAGFQWKPYGNSLSTPTGRAALKSIGSFKIDDSGEKIRVLYMTRNPIDVMISQEKHLRSGVSAHCSPNDKSCLKKHKKTEEKLHLPTKHLFEILETVQEKIKLVEDTLDEMGINYYRTTYELLYDRDDAEEWMKIFRYLGTGPSEGLTLEDINNAFPYAKTSKRSRKESISNYQEIEALLKGTDLEYFLNE